MKRLFAIGLLSFGLSGCAGLAAMLAVNATVVSVVDGIRVACHWEANSEDVQALLHSGIVGLKTVDSYVGAFCGAVDALPVAAAPGGEVSVKVGSVRVRAHR